MENKQTRDEVIDEMERAQLIRHYYNQTGSFNRLNLSSEVGLMQGTAIYLEISTMTGKNPDLFSADDVFGKLETSLFKSLKEFNGGIKNDSK